jgi:hypothetical protein
MIPFGPAPYLKMVVVPGGEELGMSPIAVGLCEAIHHTEDEADDNADGCGPRLAIAQGFNNRSNTYIHPS